MPRGKKNGLRYSKIEEVTLALLKERHPGTANLDDIWEAVLKETGLTKGQYGFAKSGQDNIRQTICSCLNALVKRINSPISQPGKGQWIFGQGTPVKTEVKSGDVLTKMDSTPVEPAPAPVMGRVETITPVTVPVAQETAPVAQETAPVAPAPIPVPVVQTVPVDQVEAAPEPEPQPPMYPWVEDDYLRTLAIAQVGCWSFWTPKGDACKACPLANHCRAKQASVLSTLATTLKNPEIVVKAPEAVANVQANVSRMLDDTRPKSPAPAAGISPPAGKLIVAAYDAVCCITKKKIKKGEKCVYIAGSGLAIPEDQR